MTPTGFKPVTFWSVVRCSIQLSYGAKLQSFLSNTFLVVTPTGFKPVTFWSVVRCSIQLSYGAISKWLLNELRDSDRIQTCNLLIRSQMLYSVELRNHVVLFNGCKGTAFFWICKRFDVFFIKKKHRFFRSVLYVVENERLMIKSIQCFFWRN